MISPSCAYGGFFLLFKYSVGKSKKELPHFKRRYSCVFKTVFHVLVNNNVTLIQSSRKTPTTSYEFNISPANIHIYIYFFLTESGVPPPPVLPFPSCCAPRWSTMMMLMMTMIIVLQIKSENSFWSQDMIHARKFQQRLGKTGGEGGEAAHMLR